MPLKFLSSINALYTQNSRATDMPSITLLCALYSTVTKNYSHNFQRYVAIKNKNHNFVTNGISANKGAGLIIIYFGSLFTVSTGYNIFTYHDHLFHNFFTHKRTSVGIFSYKVGQLAIIQNVVADNIPLLFLVFDGVAHGKTHLQ